MREKLQDLIKNTIIKEFDLPHIEKNIGGCPISSSNDRCFRVENNSDFVDIIYNSIIEYTLNEFDIDKNDYNKSMSIAIKTGMRENPSKSHGFFGEVLLHSILCAYWNTNVIIARGYFYNPTSKSETTGFDAYHLVQHGDDIQLWWGEVKFRSKYHSSIKEVFEKIKKTVRDSYLKDNIMLLVKNKNNLNLQGTIIDEIYKDFREDPELDVVNVLKKNNVTLVYPVLLVYDGLSPDYDDNIKKIINYMNEQYKLYDTQISLSLKYKIFCIIIPANSVSDIKEKVIECIANKKPVI